MSWPDHCLCGSYVGSILIELYVGRSWLSFSCLGNSCDSAADGTMLMQTMSIEQLGASPPKSPRCSLPNWTSKSLSFICFIYAEGSVKQNDNYETETMKT